MGEEEESFTFEDIISEERFMTLFQDDNPKVNEFLLETEHFQSILRWCLSPLLLNESNYLKISKVCLSFLTAPCHSFPEAVSEDPEFANTLISFFQSTAVKFPYLCYNFSKIFYYYFRATSGRIFDGVSDLSDLLIDFMFDDSILEILFFLLSGSYFIHADQIYEELVSKIQQPSEISSQVVSLFTLLFKHEGFKISQNFRSQIFSSLLSLSLISPTILSIKCLKICILIENDSCEDFLSSIESQIDFSGRTIQNSFLFQLFPLKLPVAVDWFFEQPENSFLGQSFLSFFQNSTPEEISNFLKETSFLQKVILFGSNCLSGFFSQICILLKTRNIDVGSVNVEFLEFYESNILPKEEIFQRMNENFEDEIKKRIGDCFYPTPAGLTDFDFDF